MPVSIKSFEKTTGLEFPHPVLGLDWNLVSDQILIAAGTESVLTLELRTAKGEMIATGSLPVEGKPGSIALNDTATLALLVFDHQSLIVRLSDYTVYRQLEREVGFLGGGFAEEGRIYLTIPAPSGSVDWSFWDYEKNHYQEYELERYDHYGRGAVMHPGKKLIGACWNAYQSGFLIHSAIPENKRLKYFDFGDEECSRPEYEAFAPSFNLKGDKLAFVVNPYLGWHQNIEKLVVYDIADQAKALLEVELADSEEESVIRTYFTGNDELILLHKTAGLDVVEFGSQKITRLLDKRADCIAVNPYTCKVVVSYGNTVSVYGLYGETEPVAYTNNAAVEYANTFISDHSDKLTIAGDQEVMIYAAVSNLNEIPKVYVKFGFENAVFRLDTGKQLEGHLEPSTQLEVDRWFNLNAEEEREKWQQNNGHKKKTVLHADNGSLIEIFSGKRAMDMHANIRVYYENRDFSIDLENDGGKESLPEAIRQQVNDWIDLNYEELTAAWKP